MKEIKTRAAVNQLISAVAPHLNKARVTVNSFLNTIQTTTAVGSHFVLFYYPGGFIGLHGSAFPRRGFAVRLRRPSLKHLSQCNGVRRKFTYVMWSDGDSAAAHT